MSKEGRYPALIVSRCWALQKDGKRRCVVLVKHTCTAGEAEPTMIGKSIAAGGTVTWLFVAGSLSLVAWKAVLG